MLWFTLLAALPALAQLATLQYNATYAPRSAGEPFPKLEIATMPGIIPASMIDFADCTIYSYSEDTGDLEICTRDDLHCYLVYPEPFGDETRFYAYLMPDDRTKRCLEKTEIARCSPRGERRVFSSKPINYEHGKPHTVVYDGYLRGTFGAFDYLGADHSSAIKIEIAARTSLRIKLNGTETIIRVNKTRCRIDDIASCGASGVTLRQQDDEFPDGAFEVLVGKQPVASVYSDGLQHSLVKVYARKKGFLLSNA